jgi:DNA-binding response OmpR family regulator
VKQRVLIIDDSITVRMDLKDALEEAGFETVLCATAESARDVLRREGFDVIILDVLLPDTDGLEFLRELKSAPATREIPVMLLSSEDEVRARVLGLKTGADEYLGKPYRHAQVVSRARQLARSRLNRGRDKFLALSIDDSPTFREALATSLREVGYDVASAGSGEDGLRLAADLRPDILLVDEQLPGMSGTEVLRRVRADAALRRTPCLLLTASQAPGSELRALEAGADAFVSKTEDSGVILAKMVALLRPGRGHIEMAAPSLLSPKRILVVDDSPSYLAEVAEQLRQESYDVVCAASGQEALDLLGAQSVDSILLDLNMPGLSGQETCQRVKAQPAWRDIPLIILTARSEAEAMLEGINAGADDYITKSADFDVLKARLKAQLRRRQFEDENRLFREQLLRKEMEALEMRAVQELAEDRAVHITELEAKNAELRQAREEAVALAAEIESFSYSVSHDLRAPLRSIDGFSRALMEDNAQDLDERGRGHLVRVCAAIARMEQLIDDMLGLAKVSRSEMAPEEVDLSALALELAAELKVQGPAVEFEVQPALHLRADKGLLRILLQNLLGNAWKFSAKRKGAKVELFAQDGAFTVRDNGVGFDMAYANKLFGAFQRLHSAQEFAGTGIGLATALRVVRRHGGRIWAESQVGQGASFHFSW